MQHSADSLAGPAEKGIALNSVSRTWRRALAGTIVIETIFTLPGLGRLTLDAIGWRDFTQLQGNLVTIATIFLSINLLIDLLYGVLDPRIRYQ